MRETDLHVMSETETDSSEMLPADAEMRLFSRVTDSPSGGAKLSVWRVMVEAPEIVMNGADDTETVSDCTVRVKSVAETVKQASVRDSDEELPSIVNEQSEQSSAVNSVVRLSVVYAGDE